MNSNNKWYLVSSTLTSASLRAHHSSVTDKMVALIPWIKWLSLELLNSITKNRMILKIIIAQALISLISLISMKSTKKSSARGKCWKVKLKKDHKLTKVILKKTPPFKKTNSSITSEIPNLMNPMKNIKNPSIIKSIASKWKFRSLNPQEKVKINPTIVLNF